MEKLSDRLKQRRIELNLTQAQLAELAGTKQQTIQQVESGTTKRPRVLVELAQVSEVRSNLVVVRKFKRQSRLTTTRIKHFNRALKSANPRN